MAAARTGDFPLDKYYKDSRLGRGSYSSVSRYRLRKDLQGDHQDLPPEVAVRKNWEWEDGYLTENYSQLR